MLNIQTSYFSGYRGPNAVGISGRVPDGFKGERIIELAPPWRLYNRLRLIPQEKWIEDFHKIVLNHLDVEKMAKRCNGKVLLCWEGPGKFCHRRIVAKWFETELGIIVPEWSIE